MIVWINEYNFIVKVEIAHLPLFASFDSSTVFLLHTIIVFFTRNFFTLFERTNALNQSQWFDVCLSYEFAMSNICIYLFICLSVSSFNMNADDGIMMQTHTRMHTRTLVRTHTFTKRGVYLYSMLTL